MARHKPSLNRKVSSKHYAKKQKKAIKVKKHKNTNLLFHYEYKDMLLKNYKQN